MSTNLYYGEQEVLTKEIFDGHLTTFTQRNEGTNSYCNKRKYLIVFEKRFSKIKDQ